MRRSRQTPIRATSSKLVAQGVSSNGLLLLVDAVDGSVSAAGMAVRELEAASQRRLQSRALSHLHSAASQASGKTVIRMDVLGAPKGGNPSGGAGKFTLKAGRSADQGTDSYGFYESGGQVTLTGKKGSVLLRLKARPSGLHGDSEGLDLWTGTGSISSGTGAYASLKGIGAYVGIIGPSYKVPCISRALRSRNNSNARR